MIEEVALVLVDEKPIGDENLNNCIHDMITYLLGGGYPQGLDRAKRRQFRLQSIPFVLVDGIISRKDLSGALLRCINLDQMDTMVKDFHDGPDGGHFSARTTTMKIMRADYYWPTLFNDYHKHVIKCEKGAFLLGKQRLVSLPLHPNQVDQPFSQWELDFIGPINTPYDSSHKWILAATYYFTRCIEVVALKDSIETLLVEFLDGIVTKFC